MNEMDVKDLNDQNLVNALRCVSTAGGPIGDRKKCPFCKTEPVPKNLKKNSHFGRVVLLRC